jgi:hypothetical protein
LAGERNRLLGERMKLQSEVSRLRGVAEERLQRLTTAEMAAEQMTKRLTMMVNAKEARINSLKSQINGLLWVMNDDPDAEPHTVEKSP